MILFTEPEGDAVAVAASRTGTDGDTLVVAVAASKTGTERDTVVTGR